MWDTLLKRLCALALVLSVVLALTNPSGEIQRTLLQSSSSQQQEYPQLQNQLNYNFYRETCPHAEEIIRNTMKELYMNSSTTSPQLLRLFFHDCFIGGCDASVLLDESGTSNDTNTEKDAKPNETLKGFEKIEIIKSRLEEACPRTVSCADILVLATREGIVLAGGPFYPLNTGRKDSDQSHLAQVLNDIPTPTDDVNITLVKFANKGFSARETVSLLGAHNIGSIDCTFIRSRLFNFSGTGRPDPSLPADFLLQLRAYCSNSTSRLSPPSPGIGMMYYQTLLPSMSSGAGFDTHYYVSLMRGRGLLFADQQLMATQKTAALVKAYASDDGSAFRRDFARAMVKMSSLGGVSNYQVPTRVTCSMLGQESDY